MRPWTFEESSAAANIVNELLEEKNNYLEDLKQKAKYEKMSLTAVVLIWGHPKNW